MCFWIKPILNRIIGDFVSAHSALELEWVLFCIGKLAGGKGAKGDKCVAFLIGGAYSMIVAFVI